MSEWLDRDQGSEKTTSSGYDYFDLDETPTSHAFLFSTGMPEPELDLSCVCAPGEETFNDRSCRLMAKRKPDRYAELEDGIKPFFPQK